MTHAAPSGLPLPPPTPSKREPVHEVMRVLESRARAGSLRDPVSVPDGNAPARSARLIARTAMRRESPALREVLLSRDARLAADDRHLAEYQSAPPASPEPPWLFSIRPPADSPAVQPAGHRAGACSAPRSSPAAPPPTPLSPLTPIPP